MLLHPDVEHHLRQLQVEYSVIECDPELADTAAFCEAYGVDPSDSANTILVASRRPAGQVAACVVLATTRLDVNRAVRDLMEVKKVSFAPPETTVEITGMMVGGVTPFGLPEDMPVYVDAAVMQRPEIVLGGGNRSSKLRLRPEALEALPNVRVVGGLAAPA